YTQSVTVKNDPRSPAMAAALVAQHALQLKLFDGAKEAMAAYEQVATMRAAIADVKRGNPPAPVDSAATAFDAKLLTVGGATGGGGRGGGFGGGRGGGAGAAPTFVAVNGTMNRQQTTIDFADMAPSEPMNKTYLAACAD